MSKLSKNIEGSMGAAMGVGASLLVIAIVAATDFSQLYSQRGKLQDAADMAALAGAAKLGNGGRNIESYAKEQATKLTAGTNETALPGFSANATVNTSVETVKVDLEVDVPGFFTQFMSNSTTNVKASATAKVIRDNVYCMMSLNPTASQAFDGNGSAVIQGVDCSIYVGSNAPDALSNSGTITADEICVVGGAVGTGYSVTPQTSCPVASDPFSYLSIPTAGTICDFTSLNINTPTTLYPGNYCGGIRVSGSGTVVDLAPGIYFLNNGDLKVSSSGSVQGDGVVFVLSGTASIDISGNGYVTTTPPISGTLEGFSVVQDRTAPVGKVSKITGEGRFEFPGIIYMPNQALDIAGRAIGNTFTPTYSAIVVNTLKVSGSGEISATADTSSFSTTASANISKTGARLID